MLDAFLSLHVRVEVALNAAPTAAWLAEVHQAHVASRAKFGDGLKRNLAASCAHVLDAADVLGAEINSSSEANCLLLAKQKTSEVADVRTLRPNLQ